MLAMHMTIDHKYKIISEIGRGGMNNVYCAVVEKTGKLWAVKEARLDDDADGVKRLCMMREIEVLKIFNYENVPQNVRSKIPQIADVIDDENQLIVIMDYINGISLDKLMEQKGALPEEDVIDWMRQLCEVLAYLHTHHIIYCDIKPSNIMLREDGNIAIVDFGAAKKYDSTTDPRVMGTDGFAAPEQYSKAGIVDPRTDVFCMGMTMYSLLTGIDPRQKKVTDTSVRKINRNCSPAVDRIIRKCTNPDIMQRYQSCQELAEDLQNYKNLPEPKPVSKILPPVILLAAVAVGAGIAAFKIHDQASYPEETVPVAETLSSGEHEYQVFHISMTWDEAKAYCELLGGHLATITSPEEQQQIEDLISQLDEKKYFSSTVKDHMIMIGGYKDQEQWYWVTGETWEYSNWAAGQPDSHSEITALTFSPDWVAVNPAHTYTNFICEWD